MATRLSLHTRIGRPAGAGTCTQSCFYPDPWRPA
jgi:hypothetical protein